MVRSMYRSAVVVTLAAAMWTSAVGIPGRLRVVQDAEAQPSGKPRPPSEATMAYRAAMTQLQLDVNIRYSGNADRDFAALLAAHGKALESLVAVELQHGSDPSLRSLAEQVRQQAAGDVAAARAWQADQKDP